MRTFLILTTPVVLGMVSAHFAALFTDNQTGALIGLFVALFAAVVINNINDESKEIEKELNSRPAKKKELALKVMVLLLGLTVCAAGLVANLTIFPEPAALGTLTGCIFLLAMVSAVSDRIF